MSATELHCHKHQNLPLYAIAKQIQWKWPEMYGNMFGGLHIEMTALRTLCVWLQGSRWVETLVQAEITTAGTADSLRAAHVARTRRARVTAAALYILQYRTYNNRDTDTEDEPLGFYEWCSKLPSIPVLGNSHVIGAVFTGLCVVRSQRQSSFSMYVDAMIELVPWFFALDHTNYARWIPVHRRDITELPTRHPGVARKFNAGNFTI